MRLLFSRQRLKFLLRLIIAATFILPLVWVISASLHPVGTPLPKSIWLVPENPTFDNFLHVWRLLPLGRYTLNSLLVVALAIPITLVVSSWAAFAMARLPQASQRRLVVLSLAVLMVPGIALWSTRFLIYKQLGWLDTIWSLVAPAFMGTSPFYVLMFYRAFRRIPAGIYDAARIDGAGILRTWAFIALPIARVTALAVALLSFAIYWGDFISPLLYIRSERHYTLPIALQSLQQMSRSDWPLLMAAAIFVAIIPVTLFLLIQPFFAHVGD